MVVVGSFWTAALVRWCERGRDAPALLPAPPCGRVDGPWPAGGHGAAAAPLPGARSSGPARGLRASCSWRYSCFVRSTCDGGCYFVWGGWHRAHCGHLAGSGGPLVLSRTAARTL